MKKIIAILLMAVFFSQFSFYAIESAASEESAEQPMEFALLEYLGIISPFEDGTYHSDENVTRADMAAMISRLIVDDGILAPATGTVFSDVPQEYWAADYIEMLASGNYLDGSGGGAFLPEEPAVYEHVIKLLVTVLGYRARAERTGGYPTAYLNIASGLKLDRDITLRGGMYVTYRDMYYLLYRALLAERVVQTSFGSSEQYEKTDVPLLENRFSVCEVYGRIDADSVSALGGGQSTVSGKIRIDGEAYLLSDTVSADNMLGVYVRGFAQIIRNEKKLILLRRDSDCEVLKIDAENIAQEPCNFGNMSANPTIRYLNEKDDLKTVKIPKTAQIIRNGAYVGRASEVSDETVIPTFGSVELLMNRDGQYDVIRVSSYVYYVIQSLDKELFRLIDKFGKPELDLARGRLEYNIFSNGDRITFADLNEGDVLAVGTDSGDVATAKVIQIYKSLKSVRGRVTQTDDKEITIDETTYKMGRFVVYSDDIQPKAGLSGTFCLGMEGEIVAVTMDKENADGYAWLRKLKVQTGGLDPQVFAELFTTNNRMEIISFADHVSVNDGRPVSKSEAGNASVFWQNGNVKEQLVKIKRNGKGDITHIWTEGAPGGIVRNATGLNNFYLNKYALGSAYLADDNTWVFTIPTFQSPKDSDFYVQKMTDLGAEQYSNVSIYDADSYYTAGCLVIKKGSTFMSIDLGYRSAALVESVGDAVNGEEMCKRVHVLIDGVFTYVDIPIDKYETLKDTNGDGVGDKGVVPGDVFVFLSDANKLATETDVLFDSETDQNRMFSEWYVSTGGMMEIESGNALLYTAHGTVNSLKNHVMLVNQRCLVSGDTYTDTIKPYRLEGVRVYIYDKNGVKPVTKGYIGDVTPGARIFLRGARTILREIIIYRS